MMEYYPWSLIGPVPYETARPRRVSEVKLDDFLNQETMAHFTLHPSDVRSPCRCIPGCATHISGYCMEQLPCLCPAQHFLRTEGCLFFTSSGGTSAASSTPPISSRESKRPRGTAPWLQQAAGRNSQMQAIGCIVSSPTLYTCC